MSNKKIVIDTNVLYSWTGISHNDKLPSGVIDNLAEKNQLFIATTSIIEFIVKHRKDIEKIKTCLNPIMELKVTPVSIGFTPLSNTIIKKIYKANSIEEVSSEINNILELKITKEGEFLRFFFLLIILCFFYILQEEKSYKFEDKEKVNQLNLHIFAMIYGNNNFVYELIKDSLSKGYESNNEEESIKECFSSMFMLFLRLWLFSYYAVKNSLSIKDIPNADILQLDTLKKELSDDKLLEKVQNFEQNPVGFIAKKKYQNEFKTYYQELTTSLRQHELITPEVLDYILFKMRKYLQNGAKVIKNDSMDLLLLYSLNLKSFILLTLDKKLINALETASPDSYRLIDSLGLN